MEQVWTLLGTFGGAIVVLYILKLRRRQIRVPFGPLWARVLQTEQTSALFRALKRIISLLIQLLVVTLLVLALAHPSFPGGQITGCSPVAEEEKPKIEPSFTVVALDTSASMNATDVPMGRFAAALAAARKVLLDRVDGESIMVAGIDTRFRPRSPFSTDIDFLEQQLLQLRPSDGGSDLINAFAGVRDVLAGKPNARLVLISDQALEWPTEESLSGLNIVHYPIGEPMTPKPNLAIVKLHVRPYLDDSLNYELYYEVKNFSDRTVKASLLLYANPDGRLAEDFIQRGLLVRTEALEIAPNQSLTGFVPNVEYPGHQLMGRIVPAETDGFRDVLPTDDVAYGLVPERKRLRIQLVTEENYYLEAVLFVRENLSYVRIHPDEFQTTDGFDVTIFDRFVPATPLKGNVLLIDPQGPQSPIAADGEVALPELTDLDSKHPLNWKVSLVDLNIGSMRKWLPKPDDKVIVRSSEGDPAVVVFETPAIRAVAWAFDIRMSDLPLRYAFPVMILNTLRWFHREDDALLTGRRAGTDWAVPISATSETAVVTLPQGTPKSVPVVDHKAIFFGESMGVYSLVDGDKTIPIAGNFANERESDLAARPIPGDTWAKRSNTVYNRPAPTLVDKWLTADLWKLCLLLALCILGVEWATYHRRWTV